MVSRRKFVIAISMIIFIIPVIYAAAPENQDCDCSLETNLLIVNLSIQSQEIDRLSNESEHYENLSDHYKELYESKEINVTNRELITLNQEINNLNITINDIRNELSFLKLTLKVSIPIISFTLISLWGFTIYLKRKIKRAG